MKNSQKTILVAAILGAFAVILGAFGAHKLASIPSVNLSAYQTGIQYHFYHTIALLSLGIWQSLHPDNSWIKRAALCFIIGIGCFSGSLYLLATKEILHLQSFTSILGPLTPIGGLFFILGWGFIALSASKKPL